MKDVLDTTQSSRSAPGILVTFIRADSMILEHCFRESTSVPRVLDVRYKKNDKYHPLLDLHSPAEILAVFSWVLKISLTILL